MAPPPFMTPGSVVSKRYRLVRLLGEGGMGTVFEAEDLELRRTCALKVLQVQLLGHPTAYQRFMREAEFAAGLDHEHVVRVFDRGELEGRIPFYTMELLRGRSLADTAEIEHRLPWRRVRHIGMQLCRVLVLVHARKILHRDLKPDNCFLVTFGEDRDFLKLLDFGLARADRGDPRITVDPNQVLGTAMYMSPQQARGEEVDHRADVYAVGTILYELLAGYRPFERPNYFQILEAIKNEEPPPPSYFDPRLPPEVDALVARAMHKELELRFASAEALLAAIEAIPADAVADVAPAVAPRESPPRVHTPTALAMTQAADTARAEAARTLLRAGGEGKVAISEGATRANEEARAEESRTGVARASEVEVASRAGVMRAPSEVRPAAPPAEASSTASARPGAAGVRRRYVLLTLGGVAALALAVTLAVVAATREGEGAETTPPLVSSDVAQDTKTNGPIAPPEEKTAAEEPEEKKAADEKKVADVEKVEDLTAEVKKSAAKESEEKKTTKKSAKSGALSQREFKEAVVAWRDGVKRSPSDACGRIQFKVDFEFTAQAGKDGLELVGSSPPGEATCAKDLRAAFKQRFAGKSVEPGVRVPVTVTFPK